MADDDDGRMDGEEAEAEKPEEILARIADRSKKVEELLQG